MSVTGFPRNNLEPESMTYAWVLRVFRFGIMLIAASAAIRRRPARFALGASVADRSNHVVITGGLAVEKV
jgi:hypothetical protein